MKLVSALVIFTLLFTGCQSQTAKKPKNVILMIGDGMGPGQVSLLYYYLKHTKNPHMKNVKFAFERMDKTHLGISNTRPEGKLVVDSACSATQLAIGTPSRSEMIGLDDNGEVAQTILEKAQAKGLATGLVSDTRMTHATPASFAAHVANRWSEDEISAEMIAIAPDVLFSGGANRFAAKGTRREIPNRFTLTSKRKDDRDLLKEAQDSGYQVIYGKSDLKNIKADRKVLGLFNNGNIPEAVWYKNRKDDPSREIPTLLEMSQAAIDKLSKNDKGFFLMIEGGQIDWAGHQNDAGSMLHELLSFNETINWVIDWVEKNPDTLLVITADHETGGFGIGYNVGTLTEPVKLNGTKFKGKDLAPLINYGEYSLLDILYSQKMNFVSMWEEFLALDKAQQTSDKLCEIVKDVTSITLKASKCKAVLNRVVEETKRRASLKLYKGELPELNDYHDHYYYDLANIRTSLIARAIADQLNIVWATGGHTASAVHVYSLGDESWTREFAGQLTHPQVGMKLQKALQLWQE